MAIALVTHVGAALGPSGGTTSAINTTGANFLVAALASDNRSQAVFTDSKNNTWELLTQFFTTNGVVRLFIAINPPAPGVGTNHTFTVAPAQGAGNIYAALNVAAFSGVAAFESQSGTGLNSVTSSQPPSVFPQFNNELLISMIGTEFNPTAGLFAIDSGFTITDQEDYLNGTNYGCALAYLIQNSRALVQPTWSWTGSGNAGVAQAIFTPTLSAYSQPDCRTSTATTPNLPRNVQGTLVYDVPKVDSRTAGLVVDCRTAGLVIDSRVALIQNSRTPGTIGPGE